VIRDREAQSVKDSNNMTLLEDNFINAVEKDNLKTLTLNELVARYEQIEQQGQLLQGRILLEVRSRFPGDVEFGRWCAAQTSCVREVTQQHRTRLMNLARFFDGVNRTLDKISLTAAYEISAPKNEKIADVVYQHVRGKSWSVDAVKKLIGAKHIEYARKNGEVIYEVFVQPSEQCPPEIPEKNSEYVPWLVRSRYVEEERSGYKLDDSNPKYTEAKSNVTSALKNLPLIFALDVLRGVVDEYEAKHEKQIHKRWVKDDYPNK
jgi:hypothetical protein